MFEITGAAMEGIKANDIIFQQPQSTFARVFEQLANKQDLEEDAALECFRAMFSGRMSPACIGTFLMGLKTKGETSLELYCGVRAALEEAVSVPSVAGAHLDIVGTGGDRMSSFNCSTATALTLAAMGYSVTKHGNRSVSSIAGSADILEAMGFPLDTPPENLLEELERSNFVFLFAPNYHPAFKRIVQVRKEIGAHTIFNVMGPLINPVRPTHQLLGVADKKYLMLLGEALAMSGIERGVVVHGAGGYDEVSPCGITDAVWVRDGWMKRGQIDPSTVGIPQHSPEELKVRGLEDAMDVFRQVLAGKGRPAVLDMVVLNTAVALMLFEEASTFTKAVKTAKDAVFSGIAEKKFLASCKDGGAVHA